MDDEGLPNAQSMRGRCATCGALRTNRVAGDDDAWAMMSLAAKPLARPPFPLEF